ncbi:Uracil permease [Ceratocystis lukuohia]|uniref:Uracil permease n=1 Tax=Ceratocystis lukuohia TaxID=2019550 RepID=A0ABR4M8G9_9PEZI
MTFSSQLINYDLKPVEQARRTWGPWNFVGFWIADSFNINTWMISSSMIVGGLSWWQSWLCVWIGYAIAGGFICMTGRIGATYHIGFPVASRSSFGIWGSLWPVFNRAAMACIWYGVQSYIGGHCVYLMIRSIWKSWDRNTIPNSFSESSGTTTADYASFFIFWLCSLPAIWFPVQQIRHLFTVKAFFVPCAGVGFLIWAVVRAGGIGPIIHQSSSLHGSDLAWEFVKGIMSSIANFATLIVNDPDFTRFAAKPKDAFLPQLISIPLGFGITSFIGIIVSSSSTVIYGDSIWDPLDLLEKFIDDGGAGERFGVFIIAFAFALAQLGTNIAANSVSAGTDMTALLPRYLTIRRGGYICAAVGLAMCPYTLLTSSNKFTTYLSAYSVFLSSIAGVIVADYYIVRKGFLELRDLYSGSSEGPYYYSYGVHWRAYVAYISGILINVVGFAGAVGQDVPAGAKYIYNLNFFAGFIVAAGMYWTLCHFFPVPACSSTWMEINNDVENFTAAQAMARGGEALCMQGATPVLRPPHRANIPLWLALLLKKQRRANIVPPAWMHPESLTQIVHYETSLDTQAFSPPPPPPTQGDGHGSIRAVNSSSRQVPLSAPFLPSCIAQTPSGALPYHWMEMGEILLTQASDDFPSALEVRGLLKDLQEVRAAKMRSSVSAEELGKGSIGGVMSLRGVGAMELAENRGIVISMLDGIRKLGATTEAARRAGGQDEDDDDDMDDDMGL